MTMSAISFAWTQELPPLEKLVLLGFANGSDRNTGPPTAFDHVAEFCGMDVADVMLAHAALVTRGLVDVDGYVLHDDRYPAPYETRPSQAPRPPREGWVYVLNDSPGDRVKIGWTGGNTPEARCRSVQRAAGVPLRLLTAFRGTLRDEARLHDRFAGDRLHGEWFRVSDDVAEWLDTLPAWIPA